MHKYEYTFNGMRGKVFADNRFVAQMKAAQEIGVPPFHYERITVRLVELNAGHAAA